MDMITANITNEVLFMHIGWYIIFEDHKQPSFDNYKIWIVYFTQFCRIILTNVKSYIVYIF